MRCVFGTPLGFSGSQSCRTAQPWLVGWSQYVIPPCRQSPWCRSSLTQSVETNMKGEKIIYINKASRLLIRIQIPSIQTGLKLKWWAFWGSGSRHSTPSSRHTQLGRGEKKGKKGKELGVPSQHQATCCAAGFCRVLGPNVVVQASRSFGRINGTWDASQMIEGDPRACVVLDDDAGDEGED